MPYHRRAMSGGMTLAIGLIVGWTLATVRPASLRADRGVPEIEANVNKDLITSGPVAIEQNQDSKIQVSRDAIYHLDYAGGRLVATIPSSVQTAGGTRMLGGFAERDLVADFKLTPGSPAPRFQMTTGTSGILGGDWAALYVFESSTKQVAVYRVVPQQIGVSTRPRFDLVQISSYASRPQPAAAVR